MYTLLELKVENKILTINHIQNINSLPRKAKFRNDLTNQYNLFKKLEDFELKNQEYFQIIHAGKYELESISLVCLNKNNQIIKQYDIGIVPFSDSIIKITDEIVLPLKEQLKTYLSGTE